MQTHKVFKEIQELCEYNSIENKTVKEIREGFFEIMRKHNIKQGVRSANGSGIILNNPEWTVCEAILRDAIIYSFGSLSFLMSGVPEDIAAYNSQEEYEQAMKH